MADEHDSVDASRDLLTGRSLRVQARVSRSEVRVFPLVDHAGARLDDLLDRLRGFARRGVRSDIAGIDFEFQRGASSMLRLTVS
ncbi:hypothetical protein [Nocardia gipuzkoensis]